MLLLKLLLRLLPAAEAMPASATKPTRRRWLAARPAGEEQVQRLLTNANHNELLASRPPSHDIRLRFSKEAFERFQFSPFRGIYRLQANYFRLGGPHFEGRNGGALLGGCQLFKRGGDGRGKQRKRG